jgi:biotin synthase-related radical SAM superfamily protein
MTRAKHTEWLGSRVGSLRRIRASDPGALSNGIRRTAVTAELMEHYRRQAHVMQNAGPVAAADLIEHYRRQAQTMRSAEMGTAILQVAHWLLSSLRRRLRRGRSTK